MRNERHILDGTLPKLLVAIFIAPLFAVQLFGQGAALQIATPALPNGVVGSAYPTQTLTATGGSGTYSWDVPSGSLPSGLVLSGAGVLSGTPVTANTYSFIIRVTDTSSPAQSASQGFAITISAVLAITNSTLPTGAVSSSYPATTLTATGGVLPYSWFVSSGSLPPGLTLSSDGTISGTPSGSGTFTFGVSVSDSSSARQAASRTFSVTIQTSLTITTSSLPAGVAGAFYNQQLSASGPSSVTWSTFSGSLPPGLSLSSNGTIAGTPSVPGSYDFTIQAASSDPVQTARQTLRIVINPGLTITTNATLPDAALAAPYSVTLGAIGGVSPYTWTSQDRLPAGLTLSNAGILSGIPTGLGTLSFTVQVTDSSATQQPAVRTFSLTVASILSISTASVPNALQNSAYSQQLQNVGGTAPFTWVVTKGVLPSGLTLTTGGLLQGTPANVESQTIDVTVTDSRGSFNTRSFVLTVDPPIAALSAPSFPASAGPTQQLPLAVSLAAPHPSALSGQLTLTFTSKAELPVNDPMTQFSTGSRTVNFTIPANTTNAVFSSPVMLLIGTVAGAISLTAKIDNGPSALQVATIEVLPSPPQVTSLDVVKTTQGMDLVITGYSPSRRVTSVDFNFDVKSGSKTQRVTLSRNVDSLFATWYQNATSASFGSAFSFTQSVNMQGSGTVVTVSVTLKNAQGSNSSALVHPQ